jgi:hypothetical protein
MNPRSRAEVTRFFGGLSLVPPWPGAPGEVAAAGNESWWCGVGRQ